MAPARPDLGARRRERIFYTGMAVAFALTVFAGFARTYFLRSYFGTPELNGLLHFHGIVFTGWLVLLVEQTSLVAANRTRMHRKLGVGGGVLAGLMVAVGVYTSLVRANVAGSPVPGVPPLTFLTIPLGDMVLFSGLVGAGFYYRRRPDSHKRLMMLATIAILPAALARLPFDFIQQVGPLAFFGLSYVFIAALAIYDWRYRGRIHPATLWGGLCLIISHPLRLMIGGTEAWLAFAAWLTSLAT
jgi:hypothetical protein